MSLEALSYKKMFCSKYNYRDTLRKSQFTETANYLLKVMKKKPKKLFTELYAGCVQCL